MAEPEELVIGFQKEWEDFGKRCAPFLEHFPLLKAAFDAAYMVPRTIDSKADGVVFGLGRHCGEHFLEILLLAGNGYGIAAKRAARTMLEAAATARWMHDNPEDADKFVAYSAIQKKKLADSMEDVRGSLKPDVLKRMDEAIAEGKAIKGEFMRACDKCGHKTPSGSWGVDAVTMIKKAPGLKSLVPTYYDANLHVHATPSGVESYMHMTSEGGLEFVVEPQREEADRALSLAHGIILDVLRLQHEHFGGDDLKAAVEKAEQGFDVAWQDRAK
jgi:Family of unknown function (DUF5677)